MESLVAGSWSRAWWPHTSRSSRTSSSRNLGIGSGWTGQEKTKQDRIGQDKTIRDKSSQCRARHDRTRQDKTRVVTPFTHAAVENKVECGVEDEEEVVEVTEAKPGAREAEAAQAGGGELQLRYGERG